MGMPLFEQAVSPTDAANNVKRSSITETYAFTEKDLKAAALLPEKKHYAATDLGRTGRYITGLPADAAARALTHVTSVNPFPLLPIELNDVQTWSPAQNPGY